ncbi:hypothetical protein SUGI_1164370 [Cryptomeria japonica]|nr:hypothetical protein SUGI_1164370 [Cryptomeria japonica]
MRFARCLCVLCAHGCGQKLSPSLRNEVAAQATSTCTAVCCCPLAFLHLLLLLVLFYPCTFLAKQARYSTVRATRKIKSKFLSLIESTHNREACNAREISFGFFMEIEGQMVAGEGGLECFMPQLAAAIKRKIALLKEKRSGLGRRQASAEMESSSPPFSVLSPEEEREGCQGAFQHPFWKEQFEAGQGGFWRGLNLCASTIGCSEMGMCPNCGTASVSV